MKLNSGMPVIQTVDKEAEREIKDNLQKEVNKLIF